MWDEIASFAKAQHGAVTRRQLYDAGMTRHQISRKRSTGELVSNRYAVLTPAWSAWSWRRSVMEGCLAARAAAFRRTSARLHELEGCIDQRVELLVAHSRRVDQRGLLVCRTRDLVPADLVLVDGIPATNVARTLADLGSKRRPEHVEAALEDALRRRLIDLREVITCARRLRKPGRTGPAVLWRILERRGFVAPAGSRPEKKLADIVTHRSLPPHQRQHSVQTRRGTYQIDIAYREVRLGVEYDGSHHMTPIEYMQDQIRCRALVASGWQLVRFVWSDLARPVSVRAEVREMIAVRARDLGLGRVSQR